MKPKVKWYFSFGTTLHSCVEHFFKVAIPPPPTLEEFLDFYERNWLSAGYESPEDEQKHRDYGRDILTRFWTIHQTDFHIPIALEKSFYLDIEGVKLRGFMDRVDKLSSGGLSVVDYKTNKDLFTADYLADDLQLTIYQMAAERTWGLPVERLTLYHLRSNTPCNCAPRDTAQIERTRRIITETAEKIARREFPATENEFCPCDFPEYCPFYRHKFMPKASQPVQSLFPGLTAADAVERYAAIQVMIKDLQAELDETRRIIIEFCQKEHLNRIFSGEHQVTYKLVERSGFSEDEVRKVLEPERLWEKVIGLDQSRLKQLLADETVPCEIKRKIESLKRVVSSYPQLWLKSLSGKEE